MSLRSKKTISILGVTGSVGKSAGSIINSRPDSFDVHIVTGGENTKALAEMAVSLKARKAIIANESKLEDLQRLLEGTQIQVEAGAKAIENGAGEPVDLVLAAIVGFAGLRPILRALESGINVAIANKEPLVAAGALVMKTAARSGARILPVDSEHNAIFQVLEQHNKEQIEKIILTASGGPFRDWPLEALNKATPEEAIKHPNWSMGPKISVDSATMMNKALEVIEAHHLFDLPAEKIDVLVHPQSIVHSMVAYKDGSVLAQMGPSDMRVPIAHALAWPERLDFDGPKFSFHNLINLEFFPPDLKKFPAIEYAYESLRRGQYACIALNAANEIAVEAFLAKKIGFNKILGCIDHVLDKGAVTSPLSEAKTVEEIEEYDNMMRALARTYIESNKQ